MYTGVWKYQSETKQSYCFRGYVYWYEGSRKYSQSCTGEARDTKAKALKDASKLLKTLKKTLCK